MTPLASMRLAVRSMESAREAFARAREPETVWACSTCGRLSGEVFCSTRCEVDYGAFVAQQEGRQP